MHLPVLRRGVAYRSVETVALRALGAPRDAAPVAEVSQANRGLIARDLGDGSAAPLGGGGGGAGWGFYIYFDP
jgi:hypothetical protein